MTLELSFNDWSKERIEQGRKVCTSRHKKYKTDLRVTSIERLSWGFIRKHLWKEEGADSPEELQQVIETVYNREVPDDEMFYVHFGNFGCGSTKTKRFRVLRSKASDTAKEKVEERSKWVVENTYEFEKDPCGDLFIIKSDTNSELKVSKEKLPDNSVTKALLNELKVRTFNGCDSTKEKRREENE